MPNRSAIIKKVCLNFDLALVCECEFVLVFYVLSATNFFLGFQANRAKRKVKNQIRTQKERICKEILALCHKSAGLNSRSYHSFFDFVAVFIHHFFDKASVVVEFFAQPV